MSGSKVEAGSIAEDHCRFFHHGKDRSRPLPGWVAVGRGGFRRVRNNYSSSHDVASRLTASRDVGLIAYPSIHRQCPLPQPTRLRRKSPRTHEWMESRYTPPLLRLGVVILFSQTEGGARTALSSSTPTPLRQGRPPRPVPTSFPLVDEGPAPPFLVVVAVQADLDRARLLPAEDLFRGRGLLRRRRYLLRHGCCVCSRQSPRDARVVATRLWSCCGKRGAVGGRAAFDDGVVRMCSNGKILGRAARRQRREEPGNELKRRES